MSKVTNISVKHDRFTLIAKEVELYTALLEVGKPFNDRLDILHEQHNESLRKGNQLSALYGFTSQQFKEEHAKERALAEEISRLHKEQAAALAVIRERLKIVQALLER